MLQRYKEWSLQSHHERVEKPTGIPAGNHLRENLQGTHWFDEGCDRRCRGYTVPWWSLSPLITRTSPQWCTTTRSGTHRTQISRKTGQCVWAYWIRGKGNKRRSGTHVGPQCCKCWSQSKETFLPLCTTTTFFSLLASTPTYFLVARHVTSKISWEAIFASERFRFWLHATITWIGARDLYFHGIPKSAWFGFILGCF